MKKPLLLLFFLLYTLLATIMFVGERTNDFCYQNITTLPDVYGVAKCVQDNITYKITPEFILPEISALLHEGDCYHRTQLIKKVLDKNDIKNYMDVCELSNALHARNVFWWKEKKYVLDSTYYSGNIFLDLYSSNSTHYCN